MSNDDTSAGELLKNSSASSEMSGNGAEDSGRHKVPTNEKLLRLNKRLLRSTAANDQRLPGLPNEITLNHKRLLRSAGANEQLLPCLPNEITLNHITSRLPWITFHILSSVNCSWLQAIRSHQILDARVRSYSTETFVVLNEVYPMFERSLFLYSTRDKSCRLLPRIPGFPDSRVIFAFTSMDGKIYALGGEGDYEEYDGHIYVLDIAAGESRWKQRAKISGGRKDRFGLGVVDGKIYAFCGCALAFDKCEVYHPDEDAWSPVKPCPDRRFDYQVATIGKELFLYGGRFVAPVWKDCSLARGIPDIFIQYAKFLDIYHPNKDEWRRVESFMHEDDTVFMAREKFHRVSSLEIEVYDLDKHSWTLLHSNSFASVEIRTGARVKPVAALYVNDEIVLVVDLCSPNSKPKPNLLQSIGFGSQNEVIVWETTNCPLAQTWGYTQRRHMCSIEL